MKTLYVAWQDSATRRWYPIGRLTVADHDYRFVYTKGALEAKAGQHFMPLPPFPDLHQVYMSQELFPFFANRILDIKRPEYPEYLNWLNVSKSASEPVVLLSRTGGEKATDALQIFALPEKTTENTYQIHFFSHGIRHVIGAEVVVSGLQPGDKLALEEEEDNPQDVYALKLLSDGSHVGYCPRYLAPDIHKLLDAVHSEVVVEVERTNPAPAPIQYRLLCKLTAPWKEGFEPFSEDLFKSVRENSIEDMLKAAS